jgi:2-dehydro-3-deoxyphosphooctonate aldolase (KDO 8-P synthase)
MSAIVTMQKLGCPVAFDATHSTQQPGGLGNVSGGNPQLALILAKAAIAAGANGLFLEVHTNPEKSMSDAASIMPIDWVEGLLTACKKIFDIAGPNRG